MNNLEWCDEVLAKQEKEKNRLRIARWRKERIANGKCSRCGANAARAAGACYRCTLERMAHTMFGSGKLWRPLASSFVAWGNRCNYTGKRIAIGREASPDHALPSSKYPDLRHDLDNIVWCDSQANLIKRDLTDGEFFDLCMRVSAWYIKDRKWTKDKAIRHGGCAAAAAALTLINAGAAVSAADLKSLELASKNSRIDTRR